MRFLPLVIIAVAACHGGGLSSESLGNHRLGQTIASLSGVVRHLGNPITGAAVSIGEARTTTDADGAFTLNNLLSGAQKLSVVAPGFAAITMDVDVLLGSNDVGELQLRLETEVPCGNACADNQLCTDGECQTLPYDCLANGCPVKSYCDVAQNTCLAGCLATNNCPADKVCDTNKKTCVCAQATHNCFGVCSSDLSVATCGQSCSACIAPANAVATCNGVACDFACNAGYQRCNANECCPVLENVATASSSGYRMNCATTTNNEVYCWGNNDYGTIGDGTSLTLRASPTRVEAVAATSVALGYRFSCARTQGGGVKCWGRGNTGQLGNNAASSSLTPVDVFDLTSGAVQVSAGSAQACAVLTDGRVKCWGSNQTAELGNGASGNYLVKPSYVCTNTTTCTPHFDDVAQVAAGLGFGCAVKNTHALYCWGSNQYGRLGVGLGDVMVTIPQQVAGVPAIERVEVADSHACALATDGALYCWGANDKGQLGDGTKISRSTPVLAIAQNVSAFALGAAHTCAVLQGGEVKCWGANDKSQVGDGSVDDRTSPTTVLNMANTATSVSAGDEHSCAVLVDGRMQCWGNNTDGELGDTRQTSSAAPVYVVRDN